VGINAVGQRLGALDVRPPGKHGDRTGIGLDEAGPKAAENEEDEGKPVHGESAESSMITRECKERGDGRVFARGISVRSFPSQARERALN
jgi:hypothetical protein